MAGTWGVFLSRILLIVTLSCALGEQDDLPYRLERRNVDEEDPARETKSDVDSRSFQSGGYVAPPQSALNWEEVRHDIRNILDDQLARQEGPSSMMSSLPFNSMTRAQKLRNVYSRLLLASKEKRGLYGNVLRGYKLGKREFIPYEYMNEYQKRLFGSVLNNYKFGKRVPEELPANYVTGGQIYDNISDDPRERKRVFGSVLNGYKMGKRDPRLDYYSHFLREPRYPLPSYRVLRESLKRNA